MDGVTLLTIFANGLEAWRAMPVEQLLNEQNLALDRVFCTTSDGTGKAGHDRSPGNSGEYVIGL